MKCIISFVTEIVETSSNAELGWYMKIIKPNKRTMTHTLLSSKGVVRKWSSVQGLCPTLIPHPVKVISNRRIAPTTQVSFKITGSCNVWGQVNIIYSSNSNFWFKQKINYLGVGFFMGFFFLLQPFVIGWLQDFISHRPELHAPRLNDTSSIAMSPRKLVPLIPSKTT